MVSADQVDAEIAVHEIAGRLIRPVCSRIDRPAGLSVQFQEEHASRPGTVSHIQLLSGSVKEHIRVNRVRRIGMVPASVGVKPVVAHLVDAAARSPQLRQFLQIQVIIVPAGIPAAFSVELSVLCKTGIDNCVPVNIVSCEFLRGQERDAGPSPGGGTAQIEHIRACIPVIPYVIGIPDQIRCPHGISVPAAVSVIETGPAERFFQHGLQIAVEGKSFSIAVIKIQLLPFNQILRGSGCRMGSHHIEHSVRILEYRRIMHAYMHCLFQFLRRCCIRFCFSRNGCIRLRLGCNGCIRFRLRGGRSARQSEQPQYKSRCDQFHSHRVLIPPR